MKTYHQHKTFSNDSEGIDQIPAWPLKLKRISQETGSRHRNRQGGAGALFHFLLHLAAAQCIAQVQILSVVCQELPSQNDKKACQITHGSAQAWNQAHVMMWLWCWGGAGETKSHFLLHSALCFYMAPSAGRNLFDDHLTMLAWASWAAQRPIAKNTAAYCYLQCFWKGTCAKTRTRKLCLVKHLWAMRLGIWYNRGIEYAMNRVLPPGFWGSRNSTAGLIYGPSDVNHRNMR